MDDEPKELLDSEFEPEEEEEREQLYPFVDGDDAKLRCFIFEHAAAPDLEAKNVINNMRAYYDWIRGVEKKEYSPPRLRAVKS